MIRDTTLPSDSRSPIFIGGQRRSGTSLFRVLLNRHPHIACGPESKFVQAPGFAAWHDQLANQWSKEIERYGFGRAEVDRAMAALVDNFFTRYQLREGKRRWAEKTPTNILCIEYLFRLFPRAQFIHVIRDPRDTYCSIRERMQRDKSEWVKFTPKRAAKDWSSAILAGKRWRDRPDNYMEVRYEDLVQDPETVMRRVLAFLREPWDPRVLDPEADNAEARVDQQVRRGPIRSTSLGRWRAELGHAEVAKIQSIAGELMVELRYELAPQSGLSEVSVTSRVQDAERR